METDTDASSCPKLKIMDRCPTFVDHYTQYFIQNAPYRRNRQQLPGLRPNTLRNYDNFYKNWQRFEKIHGHPALHFHQLNQQVVQQFSQWLLEDQKFTLNYAGRLIGILKTICLDAQKNEVRVHPFALKLCSFSQPKHQRILITLNFSELQKIEQLELSEPHLENTRKWILIGFWVGQRISDLMQIRPENLRPAGQGGLYLDLVQQKTQKEITVGIIHPYVVELLRNDFPYPVQHARFNRYMKAVLKAAGIHQKVHAARYDGKSKRKIYGIYPKYQVMSSHDLRRSFATNFFGKIPTPILMQMTGHSKESTFLQYIGHDPNRDSFADAFMQKIAGLPA